MPPSPAADRNLLFGILALQMDFVSRDALIAAMHAWVLDKAKPLGQILREQGQLAEDEHALLEAMVRKHLEKHGNDPEQSLAAVSSIRSVRQDLQQIADPDVQASLAHVSAARPAPDPDATRADLSTPAARRFLVLRPHAKGGLGEVFVARDEELRREVALKEIQERHADNPESRARFLLEAEVTGSLEHPGIVPVYGLGSYGDGRPFYAMRFVRGDNLKDAIERFHRDKAALPAGERALRLRQLLGRFVDVCQAIAYAHSRGVLHRDLKPGNVMLGKYGETLVVDWGLAKVLGQADVEVSEGLLVSSADSALTQAGRALGTPAYISPEQAAGRLDLLGPRSDVYSLGATLYCVLTGQAPFPSGDAGEVLRKVQRGDYPRPRALDPGIHPALEAVCRQAMALRPEDRYASPQALAEDLEKYLADEPVAAYREPLPARLARWRRRHPTLVTATALVLLTLAGAAGVGGLLLGRERERAQAEQQRALVLAEADALPETAAANVPALLKDLEAHRAEAQPRLRAQWQDAALTDARRLRLGLALADDAEIRTRLVALARKADEPQEVLLVRYALFPYAAEVVPLLWQQVKEAATPPEERFQLLAILASLDRDGADWPGQAQPATAQFLGANPLHLGAWKAALEPVRGPLLKPLGEAFRKSTEPERRRLCATLLADYAADQPDTLTELLLDADERQYAVLLPKVQAHRDRTVARLTAELDRTLAPDWEDAPLDPSWGAADPALVRQVEAAEGLVAARFALCQTLPLDQLDAVAQGLAKSGYRLVQLRPYAHNPEAPAPGDKPDAPAREDAFPARARRAGVAALWTRDGKGGRWALGLTADAVTKRDAEEQGRGLVPLDVTGYLVPGAAAEQYAAVWGPQEPGQAAVRLYAGVPGPRLAATQAALQKGQFWPRTQGYVRVREEARHAGIWARASGAAEDLLFQQGVVLGGTEAAYEGVQTPSNLQADLRLGWDPGRLAGPRGATTALLMTAPGAGLAGVPWGAVGLADSHGGQGSPGLTFAAVWRSSAERVSQAVSGLGPAAQRGRWRALIERGYRPAAVTVVEAGDGRLQAGSVWQLPVIPEANRDALARRQAQAAVALLQLGAAERVWPLLEHQPDPRLRSFLIHRFAPLQADVRALLGQLEQERQVSRRRALVLGLGSYPVEALPAEARQAWLPRLRQWYRDEPDAGLHGAVEWLLRRWGDEAEVARLEKELARSTGVPPVARQWHINGQGQTLVVAPAGAEFWMGSPGAEAGRIATHEPLYRVRIPRSFAIAAREVTVEQFLRFQPGHRYLARYSPRPDGPIINVTWYQAAAYCNWLSEKEGIPKEEWCYRPNKADQYDDGMHLAPGYLGKRGHRLPTEAEWEYACRAGAVTSRFYGEAEELLKEYAWYSKTTSDEAVRPGGLLKPNDLGLFDLYGNVAEWTQDPALLYRWPGRNRPKEDIEYELDIRDNQSRLLRGGAFVLLAPYVRSALRDSLRPSSAYNAAGFRVARTYP
jgi:formylglycine-generating enzyme required for sulfatase activity/tRNA A-37 threonylcarbamoyl transferase component Bud32